MKKERKPLQGLKWLCYLLYPPHCACCGAVLEVRRWRGNMLCAECAQGLPYLPQEKCPHCGGKTKAAGFCDTCMRGFAFTRAYAAFPYAKLRKSIHLYKFEGGKELGIPLGRMMADYLLLYHPALAGELDLILGVPLHPKKEKKRGFDQTRILCEGIAARMGLPYLPHGLYRKRHTAPQSLLSPQERKENLKDAFGTDMDFTGKRILLVDDIITSGTTCNECAKVLYRAGAAEVRVFCLTAAGAAGKEESPERPVEEIEWAAEE